MALTANSGLFALFVFDRNLISDGEVWRLASAHLVHYSRSHLLNNLVVLIPVAWVVETRSRAELLWVVCVSMFAISATVWFLEPGIERYAGASGVSLALLTFAGLRGLETVGYWRSVSAFVLAVIAAKLLAETLFGWQLVDWEQTEGFVPVASSHAAGAFSALLVWVVCFTFDVDRQERQQGSPNHGRH